tara:strand:+ start:690 stop:935 length:246 start_codon:yes stop_codon:yes gene_type:complete
MNQNLIAENHLDLRGVLCPLNFVRCKLALERLSHNDSLYVDLDSGEPEEMVIPGLQKEGHQVHILSKESGFIKIKIICHSE